MSGYNNEYEKMKSNTNETGDTTGEDHDNDNVADEDDLEKLQAEIAKMEEEAARIAAETASLEQRERDKADWISNRVEVNLWNQKTII
jgi:hypothetical protein